jgi:small Trp-rich protein
MAFVVLGVLLVALKLLDIGAPGVLSWWWILSPFAAAVVWWTWADMSGFTQRAEMDKMEEKKVARRRKALNALGIDPRAHDKKKADAQRYKAHRERAVNKVEAKREEQRNKARDSVINSRFDSSMRGHLDESAPPPADKR